MLIIVVHILLIVYTVSTRNSFLSTLHHFPINLFIDFVFTNICTVI